MQKDPVIEKLIEHDVRLERIEATMATKADLQELRDEVVVRLDAVLELVRDQESDRAATNAAIQRINDEQVVQNRDIDRIKTHVGMK